GVTQEPSDDIGDDETCGNDCCAEDDLATQGQDLVEDVGDRWEVQHLSCHHAEEQHDSDLDDAGNDSRCALAFGNNAPLGHDRVGTHTVKSGFKQLTDELGNQDTDCQQSQGHNDLWDCGEDQLQHLLSRIRDCRDSQYLQGRNCHDQQDQGEDDVGNDVNDLRLGFA